MVGNGRCKDCTPQQTDKLTCCVCTKTMPLKAFAKAQRKHVEKAVPPQTRFPRIPRFLRLCFWRRVTDGRGVLLVSRGLWMRRTIRMNLRVDLKIQGMILRKEARMEKLILMLMVPTT